MSKIEEIDLEIGTKIQSRRKQIAITRKKVAKELGISYQQLAKYETGKNRVSASMLVKIANSLSTNMEYFFDKNPNVDFDSRIDVNVQIKELSNSFRSIKDNKKRELIIKLTNSFVEE